MTFQMEYLENSQDNSARTKEREKQLLDTIATFQIENDRLRAENRLLNDGSCVERLQTQLKDSQEAAKVLFDRTGELVKENDRLNSEVSQLERALDKLHKDRRAEAKRAVEWATQVREDIQTIRKMLSAWSTMLEVPADEAARINLVQAIMDNLTMFTGYLDLYSDGTLLIPGVDDIPF